MKNNPEHLTVSRTPRPGLSAQAVKDQRIAPMVFEVDGETVIVLVDFNSKKPSPTYHYGTKTGKVTRRQQDWPAGEWIGEIHVSPSVGHRVWVAVRNLLNDFNIPTEPDELEKFINTRGEKGSWYRLGNSEDGSIQGSVYLPRVWALVKSIQAEKHQGTVKKPKGTAVIGGAVVAPKHVRKGFGTMLHVLAASHFKQQGYKFLSSDIVGLNTDSEIAVWKRLQKDFDVESFTENGLSTVRVLRGCDAIDDNMAQFLNNRIALHINGNSMTLKEISNTAFPQFEMDLTDERVPLLVTAERAA